MYISKRKQKLWELDFIRLAYPDNETKEIAKILNKSEGTIKNIAQKNKILKQKKDLLKPGDEFGFLTVKERIFPENNIVFGEKRWKCECVCGKFSICSTNTLTSGHSSSCGCKRIEAISNSFKDITGTWYNAVKKNAKVRGLEFTLSREFLYNLLEKQQHKCKLSGLPISIAGGRNSKDYYQNTTASLDRIDNTKGYVEDNVQFLHKHINYMKWTHEQSYFIELCKKVIKHNESVN